MSYGSPEWSPWVLEEEEAIKHIKAAYAIQPCHLQVSSFLNILTVFSYDAGIQSFDTSNVIHDLFLNI